MLGKLSVFLVLFAGSRAIGKPVSTVSCESPYLDNIDFSLNDTKERTTWKYSVSCQDADQFVLFGLEIIHNVTCTTTNGSWVSDESGKPVSPSNFKCRSSCTKPAVLFQGNWEVYLDLNEEEEIRVVMPDGSYGEGTKLHLYCDDDHYLAGANSTRCLHTGRWSPPMPRCVPIGAFAKTTNQYPTDEVVTSKLIVIIVCSSVSVMLLIVIMVTLVVKARKRFVCCKSTVPRSHPDDPNYPRGYTQLGSDHNLPTYDDATGGRELESHVSFYNSRDYHQLPSSTDGSSRSETDSLSQRSVGTHRHSLFSGSSSHYRTGDCISDILQADHMSMSDTSTLVTINTYESSATASNPSLTQSRRGVAGSVSATDTNSMDDTPLITGSGEDLTEHSADHNQGL